MAQDSTAQSSRRKRRTALIMLALLALVPIWLYRGRQGHHSKPFQYACYAFYPVHMLVLAVVLRCVNR